MTFDTVLCVDRCRILRHKLTGTFYLAWHDQPARQGRRASLRTRDLPTALRLVDRIAAEGLDDPRPLLRRFVSPTAARNNEPAGPSSRHFSRLLTVREILDLHLAERTAAPLNPAEEVFVRILKASPIGDRPVEDLRLRDFDRLRDQWLGGGRSIATVSRILTTLRSAINRAVRNQDLDRAAAPFVPEYRTTNHIRSAPPKGRPCSLAELGRLYAASRPPHLRLALFILMNTGCRLGAALDLTTASFDLANHRISLNGDGRIQTTKHRPILPLTRQLDTWGEALQPFSGRLVSYGGRPVARIARALRHAAQSAGLDDEVNTYSIRHTAGRVLRQAGCSTEEIALWFGHNPPIPTFSITLRYSPYEPGFLERARLAVEDMVEQIGRTAGVDLSAPPADLIAYLKTERDVNNKLSPRLTGVGRHTGPVPANRAK